MGILLWVDDYRRAPDGWYHARTVTDAIRVLATMPVDEVSLDHDIAHTVVNDNAYVSCPEDYTPVARYMAAMCVDDRPKKVRIHTANPGGAAAIALILKDCIGTDVAVKIAGEE